jgi:hypothetical protein
MQLDEGPFYQGTTAILEIGDLLTPGFPSNYRSEVIMNHIYFTALKDGAGMAAELAVLLRGGHARAHVYLVEPQGQFQNDPNVTDKKFPGNPTRSYRTDAPLKVLREVDYWTRMSAESLALWAERLANLKSSNAEIIN